MLDDLVVEIQNKFDEMETMIDGLALDQGYNFLTLDDETLISSISAMTSEYDFISQQLNHQSVTGEGKVKQSIEQYNIQYQKLREEKDQLRNKLLETESIDRNKIIDYISKNKQQIMHDAIEETAKIVESRSSVTKRDIDRIYLLALKKQVKGSLLAYINSLINKN